MQIFVSNQPNLESSIINSSNESVVCGVCHKSFASVTSRKRHEKIHLDIRSVFFWQNFLNSRFWLFSSIVEENGKDHINAFTARNFFHSRAIWIFICVVIQVFGHINVTNATNHLPEETPYCAILKYMKIKMTIEVLTMTKKLISQFCLIWY